VREKILGRRTWDLIIWGKEKAISLRYARNAEFLRKRKGRYLNGRKRAYAGESAKNREKGTLRETGATSHYLKKKKIFAGGEKSCGCWAGKKRSIEKRGRLSCGRKILSTKDEERDKKGGEAFKKKDSLNKKSPPSNGSSPYREGENPTTERERGSWIRKKGKGRTVEDTRGCPFSITRKRQEGARK